MKYTIKKINKDSVEVVFDIDGVKQNISGAPIDTPESLKKFLHEYARAYKQGKESDVKGSGKVVPDEVKALVDQEIDTEVN